MGNTPLHAAMHTGRKYLVKILLHYKANLDVDGIPELVQVNYFQVTFTWKNSNGLAPSLMISFVISVKSNKANSSIRKTVKRYLSKVITF